MAPPDRVPDTNPLEAIRFRPERALVETLFARFGLEVLIDHFVESGGARSLYDVVLASHLRLTPLLAPRLCSLLDETRAKLGFDQPIEMFVTQAAEVNAATFPAIAAGEPHVLTVTSALIERMSDDELRFVLGHELAHVSYRHHRVRLALAAFGDDEHGESRAPPLLARRLESWDRLAEISADRAGFVATDERLEVAVGAFFKTQTGLGPEHLRFDVRAYVDQLEALQRLERRELLARFSHPATPIRVRALQLFGSARAAGDPTRNDGEIASLASLMDYAPSEPLEIHLRDLLLAGGLLLADAGGGEIDEREWNVLVHLLLPYCADPEAEVARVRTTEDAEALLVRSAAFVRANASEERFEAIRRLANVAAVDGDYDDAELATLHRIAEMLAVPIKGADSMLYDVLADHLQTQAVRGAPIPRLRRASARRTDP